MNERRKDCRKNGRPNTNCRKKRVSIYMASALHTGGCLAPRTYTAAAEAQAPAAALAAAAAAVPCIHKSIFFIMTHFFDSVKAQGVT